MQVKLFILNLAHASKTSLNKKLIYMLFRLTKSLPRSLQPSVDYGAPRAQVLEVNNQG